MENASKALIIAGAILLAILLISLGIMIFGQAQDTVNNSGMSQAELQSFNNKFIKYEGTKTGSEAKALVNEVISSNAGANNSNRKVSVELKKSTGGKGEEAASTTTPSTSGIITSLKYKIELGYDSGAVNTITITAQD